MTDINGLIAEQVAQEVAKRLDVSALADTIVKSVDANKIAKGMTDKLIKSVTATKFELDIDGGVYIDPDKISNVMEKHVISLLTKALKDN